MARTPPRTPTRPDQPFALTLAQRLRDALKGDASIVLGEPPAETNGIDEPGAIFEVEDERGHRYRVRVIHHGRLIG